MAMDENQIREKAELDAAHADPASWRGQFYFNRRDHRVFPPKQAGASGWTVNWANPASVTVFILFVLLTIGFVWGLGFLFEGH